MNQVPAKSVVSRERAADAFFYRGPDVLDMYIDWNKDRLRVPTLMMENTPSHPQERCFVAHGHRDAVITPGTWIVWYPGSDVYWLMDSFTFDNTFRDADAPA